MKEPLYRWVCTMCGISDEAESAEMARLNIDVHVQVTHPSAREPVRVQLDPTRDHLQGAGEHDEEPGRGQVDDEDDRGDHP
jgi:hypothetical protein